MKVLLLSPAYPPQPVVGALRAGNLVKAFLDAGHEVTVLAERLPGRAEGPDPAGRKVRTVPVEMGAPFAKRLHGLLFGRRDVEVGVASPQELSPAPGKEKRREVPGTLRQTVRAFLSIPDIDQHMVLPLVRAGQEALKEQMDLVYSTAPPFSAHVAGLLLHELTRTPWVAEFRDPWNHPWADRLASRHPATRGLDALLERWVLRRADALVAVTESARSFLANRLPIDQATKVLLARNGVPPASIADSVPLHSRASGPFTIVYAGSLYLGRNPVRFLEGMARFISRRNLRPADLRVRFIGRCSEFENISIVELADRLGLKGILQVEDWMSHQEITKVSRAADALLIFAQKQPLQVPNKLYEYLATGTPILAFVDRDGESANLLRDAGDAELLFEPEVEDVSNALERFFDRRESGGNSTAGRRALPEDLRTDVQLGALVAELGRRFGRRGH